MSCSTSCCSGANTEDISLKDASQAGLDCECRSMPLDLVPRALVNRDTRGLVKIVAERKTGRMRGAMS